MKISDKIKFLISLGLYALVVNTYAAPSSEELSLFCEQLLSQVEPTVSFFGQRRLSKVDTTSLKPESSFYGSDKWLGENTILIMTPTSRRPYSQLKKEFKKTNDLMKPFLKDLKELKSSGNVTECVTKAKNFPFKDYKESMLLYQKKMSSLKTPLETYAIDEEIKKLSRRVKKRWYIKRDVTVGELKKYLLSPLTKNLIIVGHASSQGHLFDKTGRKIPQSAFDNISPTIFSLSFYSCYSQLINEYYNLESKLQETFAFYPERKLYLVQEDSRVETTNLAPLSRTDNYIEKVDRDIRRKITFLGVDNQKLPKMCKLKLKENPQSILAVTMNGRYLGDFMSQDLYFPCSLLKDQNTLFVRPALSGAFDKDTTVQIDFPHSRLSVQKFPHREGNLKGIKIKFEKN